MVSDVVGQEGGWADGLDSKDANAQQGLDAIDFACRKAITGGGDLSRASQFFLSC